MNNTEMKGQVEAQADRRTILSIVKLYNTPIEEGGYLVPGFFGHELVRVDGSASVPLPAGTERTWNGRTIHAAGDGTWIEGGYGAQTPTVRPEYWACKYSRSGLFIFQTIEQRWPADEETQAMEWAGENGYVIKFTPRRYITPDGMEMQASIAKGHYEVTDYGNEYGGAIGEMYLVDRNRKMLAKLIRK